MNSRKLRIRACATVAVIFLGQMAAQTLATQPRTGKISGHVGDVVGAVIGGASVFVRQHTPSGDVVRLVTHTDSNGEFKLELPEGGYDILVTSQSFQSQVETVSVEAGKTKKLQWKLKALGCDFPGMNCDSIQ